MLIGLLFLGMVLGMIAATGLLFAGYSFLTALIAYSIIGSFVVVATIPVLAMVQRFRSVRPHQHQFSD